MKGNITSMAWECTPVIAIIVMALYFLPSLFVGTVGPMMVRVTRDFLPRIMGS